MLKNLQGNYHVTFLADFSLTLMIAHLSRLGISTHNQQQFSFSDSQKLQQHTSAVCCKCLVSAGIVNILFSPQLVYSNTTGLSLHWHDSCSIIYTYNTPGYRRATKVTCIFSAYNVGPHHVPIGKANFQSKTTNNNWRTGSKRYPVFRWRSQKNAYNQSHR